MKAWLVREKDEFCATVVFAETRGKARALAQHTDVCEDARFCDIEAYRKPSLDKYYKDGKWEMDWCDPRDRLALVKDGNFVCSYDYVDFEECPTCSAKDFCDMYKDHLRDIEEDKP